MSIYGKVNKYFEEDFLEFGKKIILEDIQRYEEYKDVDISKLVIKEEIILDYFLSEIVPFWPETRRTLPKTPKISYPQGPEKILGAQLFTQNIKLPTEELYNLINNILNNIRTYASRGNEYYIIYDVPDTEKRIGPLTSLMSFDQMILYAYSALDEIMIKTLKNYTMFIKDNSTNFYNEYTNISNANYKKMESWYSNILNTISIKEQFDNLINSSMLQLGKYNTYLSNFSNELKKEINVHNNNILELLNAQKKVGIGIVNDMKEKLKIVEENKKNSSTTSTTSTTSWFSDIINSVQQSLKWTIASKLNPMNWNWKIIGSSALIASIIAGGYYLWKKYWDHDCSKLTDIKEKAQCEIKAMDKSIGKMKSELDKCDSTVNPSECKKQLNDLVNKWEQRKRDLQIQLMNPDSEI